MPKRSLLRSLPALAAAAVLLGLTSPAPAQDLGGDPDLGARVWRELSVCAECHGWAGDGVPDIPQFGGANLRETALTPELAYETIRCGRPGTSMPAFFRGAWSERIPCYGMTAPMERGVQPDAAATPLADRYIKAVVAFIFRDFAGQGPVTREYCESVFSNAARCSAYPPAAATPAAVAP
ncbi:MAG: cytochrome c [Bauldia sp.]|nr:cytochrome c [Bauldia sp.]